MTTDSKKLLNELCILSEEAGKRILEVYRSEFAVTAKEDDSPLTAADQASHTVLMEGLRELTPDIPVLSEEGETKPYRQRQQWSRYWLIDPLDGTREFIKRNGEFTVNIALIEHHCPVLGVVHAPDSGTTWYGSQNSGAYLLRAGIVRPLHTRRVSSPITAVVSRSHRGERVDSLLERLPELATVSVGSSLKFCLVAEGKADLYPRFGPTSEWDTAAAQAVVEAAGGRVTRIDFSPLRYNTKESLLNPDFIVVGDPHYDWARYLDRLHGEER
jgi:3'(2'), 5'-bisphosphate nucleotidase